MKTVKGKVLTSVEPNTKYMGCTFYLGEIQPEDIVNVEFDNCSFRGNKTKLDLSCEGLSEIPRIVFQITSLGYLDLDSNNISVIPKEIGNLSSLGYLDLSRNNISAIPKEIGNLSSLTRLYLSSNNISAIPKELDGIVNI